MEVLEKCNKCCHSFIPLTSTLLSLTCPHRSWLPITTLFTSRPPFHHLLIFCPSLLSHISPSCLHLTLPGSHLTPPPHTHSHTHTPPPPPPPMVFHLHPPSPANLPLPGQPATYPPPTLPTFLHPSLPPFLSLAHHGLAFQVVNQACPQQPLPFHLQHTLTFPGALEVREERYFPPVLHQSPTSRLLTPRQPRTSRTLITLALPPLRSPPPACSLSISPILH